jgi:transposase-like protein
MAEVIPLLVHSGDEDFLKSLAERVLEQLMKFEVTNPLSGSKHERADQREGYRNGYRERPSHTRTGTLDVRVPKLRQGNYFPNFLKLRRLTKKALTAVIQEAWIGGMSSRKVDDLVQALGMTGISKNQVSALCQEIHERVDSFPLPSV